mmetsp:Transcript_97567/g.271436  ORF Transcript_97567/g.271436 Transcript_97567/m.271436 type:complete len:294 (-) Transcript_97567:468-1349(-)
MQVLTCVIACLLGRAGLRIAPSTAAAWLLVGKLAAMLVESVHADRHPTDTVLRPIREYACSGLCRGHDDKPKGCGPHTARGGGARGFHLRVRDVHCLHLAVSAEVTQEQIRGAKPQLVDAASDKDGLRVLGPQRLQVRLHSVDRALRLGSASCALDGHRDGRVLGASVPLLPRFAPQGARLLPLPLSTAAARCSWQTVSQHAGAGLLSPEFLSKRHLSHLAGTPVCGKWALVGGRVKSNLRWLWRQGVPHGLLILLQQATGPCRYVRGLLLLLLSASPLLLLHLAFQDLLCLQ